MYSYIWHTYTYIFSRQVSTCYNLSEFKNFDDIYDENYGDNYEDYYDFNYDKNYDENYDKNMMKL